MSDVYKSVFPYNVGDCIEFKRFVKMEYSEIYEYTVSKGIIINILNPDMYEVKLYIPETEQTEHWVNRSDIIKHYPKEIIPSLTPRLVLRGIWKDLIFREVKTVKYRDQSSVTHQYINNNGFLRTRSYDSIGEAFHDVDSKYHHNIQVHFNDYYGFTNVRTVANNDIYYNQEIFFSKKCYGELNLNGRHITGDFMYRRSFNSVPPSKKQYICGFVENGEKGLFYRKWFTCSKEFMILWTMVCEPDSYSLRRNLGGGRHEVKKLNELLLELDTSQYNIVHSSIPIDDKKKRYACHNLENSALYLPTIYQDMAMSLFGPDIAPDYNNYSSRIKEGLLWMKYFPENILKG